MKTLELSLLATLALATALFFIGQLIVRRSEFLQRHGIPVPVVGGVLVALLLAFFATLGPGADVPSLLPLLKERAKAGMTIPMHEGARRYFDRPVGAPADSGIP